jgi:subtilisin-like proprotein convertase family protein
MTRFRSPAAAGTRRVRSRRGLRVEALEDRTVPAAFDPATGVGHADDGREFIALTELPDLKRAAGAGTGVVARGGGGSAAPPIDPAAAFQLHSRPTATKVIYLDFTGHTTTGTAWNDASHPTIVTPAYDLDNDPSTFSTTERQQIIGIWQRVAEDYSPFDVDVTTEDPGLTNILDSGAGDTRWGVRACIGGDSTWLGSQVGGIAFVGSFGDPVDTNCFVFADNLGSGDEKFVADAAAHEIGHTLGLSHDGRNVPGQPHEEYYEGQGSGETGWAPIMGVGYYENLSQWSKGEYPYASNHEDDLAIITSRNGFGYRPDDHGSTIAGADAVTVDTPTSISGSGVIERRGDLDFFSVRVGAGPLSITVRPNAKGPDLDVLAQLYDQDGNKVASANPPAALAATLTYTAPHAGTYYLKIDGTGKGSPLTGGYSDYASLGQYTFTGTIVEPPPPVPIHVIGVSTIESPTGLITAVRLTLNVPLEPTSLGHGNLRVTGPTGAAVTVLQVRPVTGQDAVYDLVIRPQKFVGSGGVRVYLSPAVSTGLKQMDEDLNGTDGEPDDFLGAASYPFNSTAAGAIPDDGTPAEFPIDVPALVAGQPFTVTDVNVRVNLTHPYVSDLLVELVSPSNKVVKLFDHRGADGNDLKDTRFDDLATKTLGTAIAPFVGVFKPDGGSLADFVGDDAVGTWKLRITDAYAGAAGQLNSWGLTITTDRARVGLHVTAVTPVNRTGSAVATLVSGLTLDFDRAVNPATLTAADVRVTDPSGLPVRVLSVVPAAGTGNTRFLVATAPWLKAGNYAVKVGPAVADVLGNGMDTNDNGGFLDATDAFTTTVPVANHVFRSRSRPTAIPNGTGSLTSAITVGTSVAIGSLAVELNLQHTNVADLRITLIAPNGTQIVLVNHTGTGANFVRTVLSDEATATIASGAAPYRGDFRPDVAMTSLIGINARGTWKLRVEDTVTGADVGQLLSWALYVKPV